MKRRGGFFKSNWAYLLWFSVHFSLSVLAFYALEQNILRSGILSLVCYAVAVVLALSPAGEYLVRLIENMNPVKTQKNADYLLPIFEEVYEEVRSVTPKINSNIRLYISESMTVNAFAVGRKTIAVTRGAIHTFSSEELKGVLAHEFGHMANGDTKALLFSNVGNGFFSLLLFVLRIFMNTLQAVVSLFDDVNLPLMVLSFFFYVLRLLIDFIIFLFEFLGEVILSLNSRYSEYLADEYAFSLGFGDELKNALYVLHQISLPAKATITERLKATHPHLNDRIQRLEQLALQSA